MRSLARGHVEDSQIGKRRRTEGARSVDHVYTLPLSPLLIAAAARRQLVVKRTFFQLTLTCQPEV